MQHRMVRRTYVRKASRPPQRIFFIIKNCPRVALKHGTAAQQSGRYAAFARLLLRHGGGSVHVVDKVF